MTEQTQLRVEPKDLKRISFRCDKCNAAEVIVDIEKYKQKSIKQCPVCGQDFSQDLKTALDICVTVSGLTFGDLCFVLDPPRSGA